MSLAKLLGVDTRELQAEAGGFVGLLRSIDLSLRRLSGRADREGASSRPIVRILAVQPGAFAELDIERLLSNEYRAGWIQNVGTQEADLSIEGVGMTGYAGPIPLVPSDVPTDLSRFSLAKLRVDVPSTNTGASRIVVVLQ